MRHEQITVLYSSSEFPSLKSYEYNRFILVQNKYESTLLPSRITTVMLSNTLRVTVVNKYNSWLEIFNNTIEKQLELQLENVLFSLLHTLFTIVSCICLFTTTMVTHCSLWWIAVFYVSTLLFIYTRLFFYYSFVSGSLQKSWTCSNWRTADT